MAKTSTIAPHTLGAKLGLLGAILGIALLAVPSGYSGGGTSIIACDGAVAPASCTASASAVSGGGGVYFKVTSGGGNRDYASVEVTCTDGSGVVYGTIINVMVEPKSAGVSQTIYPPASDCVANLLKQMAIGKARVLASVQFEVTP